MNQLSFLFCCAISLSLTTGMASDGLVQTPAKPAVRAQPTTVRTLGTHESSSQHPLDSVYIRLLERTNQQLSLWWNPYAVMVATLGALFAVLAIVAAVIIFRQGREYRSLITRSIAEYQGILNAFIEEKNREIEVMGTRVTKDLERATTELKTATGAQKARIETEIANLKKVKESLKPYEQPKFVTPGLEWSTATVFPSTPIGSLGSVVFPSTLSFL